MIRWNRFSWTILLFLKKNHGVNWSLGKLILDNSVSMFLIFSYRLDLESSRYKPRNIFEMQDKSRISCNWRYLLNFNNMFFSSGKLFLQNKIYWTSHKLELILDSLFSKFIESDSSPESLPSAHRKDTNWEDFLSTGARPDTDTLFAKDFKNASKVGDKSNGNLKIKAAKKSSQKSKFRAILVQIGTKHAWLLNKTFK